MKKIAFLFLLLASLTSDAKPTKPGEAPAKKKPEMMKSCLTNWGELNRVGPNFSLRGHPTWDGEGQIRKDGRVFILWTLKSDGRAAPGVYEIQEDGSLKGAWQYGELVEVNDNGDLVPREGIETFLSPDVTHRLPDPEPET